MTPNFHQLVMMFSTFNFLDSQGIEDVSFLQTKTANARKKEKKHAAKMELQQKLLHSVKQKCTLSL